MSTAAGGTVSGLWVLVPNLAHPENLDARYVRGDQITEVRRRIEKSRGSTEFDRFSVGVTIIDAAGRRNVDLWELPDQPSVGNAALALMQILSSDQAGVVVLNDETRRPELQPFSLNVTGLPD